MKILSIAVPVFNAESFIAKCLDSVMPFRDKVELLLVNDGSTDGTEAILQSYVERYPDSIRLFNKENGGAGSAVNLAIRECRTPWFKTLDSDDYLIADGLHKLISVLEELEEEHIKPELLVSDFVYELPKHGPGSAEFSQTVQDYSNVFTQAGISSWSRMRNFALDQVLGKYCLTYRQELLEKIHLRLPEYAYFTEQIYVYEPLPHVRRIYYLDTPVYAYSLGREEQASNMGTLKTNNKQLIAVALEMFRRVRLDSVRPQRLQRYMYKHMSRVIAACMMPLGQEELGQVGAMHRMDLLWEEFEKINPVAAKKLRNTTLLHPKRILKASRSYMNKQVYNLIGKVFIL